MNKNELYADRRSFSFFMLVNVAAAELILILIFIFITGKFVTPITHVTKRFQVLARGRGDLSVRIPVKGKDETSDLANAFNTFSNKLREIIVSLKDQITFNSLTMGQFDTNIEKTVNQLGNMNDAVSEIDNEMKQIISRIQESFSAASEINKSADTIQQKAFGQNAAVEQSSASIEELVAAINNLASVADSRMKVIEDLNNSARKGQDRMNDTENSIAKISDSAGIIQELITVIDNIAQNTNLLAMNAAIEAAHAGEAGKGFSVVADEIRKLAENTQENSHNITENINSILETISSTQDVTKITGQAIDEIVDDVKNVYEGIKEIQSGLNEMASGTQEITSSIHMLSETSGALSDSTVDIHDKTGIIEQTLSSVSELAANTEKTVEAFMQSAKHVLELTRQMNKMGQNAVDNAGRMNDSVKQFKT